jgi:DNA-directed RNA polymerase specialized sigma24 family protein
LEATGMGHRRSALETQLLRLAPRMRRFALVLTQGAPESANGLVAAAYDNLWRKSEKRDDSQLDVAAFTEMVTLWRDHLSNSDCFETPAAAPQSSPKAAILSLPIDDRVVIGLMVIERLSAQQTGAVLSISPQRAAQIHSRARRALDVALGANRRAEGAA